MTATVDLLLTGATLPGCAPEQVVPALAKMLRITEERALKMLRGQTTVLKRQMSVVDAGKYLQAFQRLGVIAETRENPPPVIREAASASAFPELHAHDEEDVEADESVDRAASVAAVEVVEPVEAPTPTPAPTIQLPDPWALLKTQSELASVEALTITPEPEPAKAMPASFDYSAVSGLPAATGEKPAVGLALVEELDEVSCPACDLRQPKRTLCRGCGVDMPRLRVLKNAEADETRGVGTLVMSNNGPLSRDSDNDDDNGTPVFAFSLQGRIGRLRYLAYQWVAMLPVVLIGVLAALGGMSIQSSIPLMIAAALLIFFIWFRTTVLRLHDFGFSGKWIFVPLVVAGGSYQVMGVSGAVAGPIFFLILHLPIWFLPGSKLSNGYGEPPSPNSPLVILAAVSMLVLSGVSYTFKGDKMTAGKQQSTEEQSDARDYETTRDDDESNNDTRTQEK